MGVDGLQDSFAGELIVPGDGDYDRARRCFNALVDKRPAVIARCADADDVAIAFAFARDNGLDVSVRGGGHNPAGHCLCDGLVIDLSRMRAVRVDAERRIARAEGGATWLDFDSATTMAGLATPGGVVGSTGVTGLTFGGGIGHLTAQLGLTCDSLVAAELVTSGGERVRADADENSELLWALRGAGGNFGVATAVEFRLHPVGDVLGGALRFRGRDGVRQALRVFRDIAARNPRTLSFQAGLDVDELNVLVCFTGGREDAALLRELSSVPGIVRNEVRRQTFLDQQLLVDSSYGVNRHYWKGHFVRELPDELIDDLIARVSPLGGVLFESLHGAPKDVDPGTAVVGFRDAAFNITAQAVWQSPDDDDVEIAWARETAEAVAPWSYAGGGYANYMETDEPASAAFGHDAFERLRRLKARFDPDNVLRRNQNIAPAGVR